MGKVRKFIAKEVRDLVPPFLLFLFLFHMIILTKTVSLGNYSITAFHATAATIGALIVAKSVLVVEALPLARLFSSIGAVHILWKTLLFGAVTLIFKYIEELIPLVSKYGGLVAANTVMLREVSWPVFWVLSLWIFGGLLFYCIAAELSLALGPEKAKEIFFGTSNE